MVAKDWLFSGDCDKRIHTIPYQEHPKTYYRQGLFSPRACRDTVFPLCTAHVVGAQLLKPDPGIGIAAANIERIFEPFDQEDNSESRRPAGFELWGLGFMRFRGYDGLRPRISGVGASFLCGGCKPYTLNPNRRPIRPRV